MVLLPRKARRSSAPSLPRCPSVVTSPAPWHARYCLGYPPSLSLCPLRGGVFCCRDSGLSQPATASRLYLSLENPSPSRLEQGRHAAGPLWQRGHPGTGSAGHTGNLSGRRGLPARAGHTSLTTEDGSIGLRSLVSSATTLSFADVTPTSVPKRWGVEGYRQSLKQHGSFAQSPTQTVTPQPLIASPRGGAFSNCSG